MSLFCPGGAISMQTLTPGGGCFLYEPQMLRHGLRTPIDFGQEQQQRRNWILLGMVVSLLLLGYLAALGKR